MSKEMDNLMHKTINKIFDILSNLARRIERLEKSLKDKSP